MPDRDDLIARLREWRAGVHHVTDQTGRETGELVDEPKDFATMQKEREEAADSLEFGANRELHYEKKVSALEAELERVRGREEKLQQRLDDSMTAYAELGGENSFLRQQVNGLDATIDRFPSVLKQHYLAGIECDHEAKTDRASCACSRVSLPVCDTVGEAVDSWIEHVAATLSDERMTDVVEVRLCIFCGEREDTPFRSAWCEVDPYGQSGKHRWGNPQPMPVAADSTGGEAAE